MDTDPKNLLSRRRALGRISALALGAYAAPAFTTLSVARASDGSDASNGSDASDGSDTSLASEISQASLCSSASGSDDCES